MAPSVPAGRLPSRAAAGAHQPRANLPAGRWDQALHLIAEGDRAGFGIQNKGWYRTLQHGQIVHGIPELEAQARQVHVELKGGGIDLGLRQ